jgi:zinc D-Ala-D-Ala carboxypeptidase
MSEQLSKDFKRSEFACKGAACCGHSAPIMPALVDALQELRDIINEPIGILSGFRCRTHNKNVGGAADSQHCYGIAADIYVKGMSPVYLAGMAEKVAAFREGGIGIYKSWVHVDVRHGKARWNG